MFERVRGDAVASFGASFGESFASVAFEDGGHRARVADSRGVDDRLEVRVRVRGEERSGRRSTHRRAAVAGRETNGSTEGSALAEPADADSDAEPVDLDPGDAFGSRAANAGLWRRDKTSCASWVRCSGRVGSSAVGFEPSTSGRAYGWSGRSREGTWNPSSSSRASEGTYMPEIPLRPVYPLA